MNFTIIRKMVKFTLMFFLKITNMNLKLLLLLFLSQNRIIGFLYNNYIVTLHCIVRSIKVDLQII